VATNNSEPTLTDRPIPFKRFTAGELARLKLGMTMSEVVEAWGKPNRVGSHCAIGPRFWYVSVRSLGDVSLSFRGDRLVLIAISGETARHVGFDNGLSGNQSRADYERAIGQPELRNTEDLGLYNGEIAYRRGSIRISFEFQNGRLAWAAVCLEAEAKRPRLGEPGGAANRGQPVGPETNRTQATAAPGG
jgi:hypothetical protein